MLDLLDSGWMSDLIVAGEVCTQSEMIAYIWRALREDGSS